MSLSFEDYVAFVERVSDYAPENRRESGLCGLISETGELLALFDERRVKRKGLPSRDAILSELGDVLWYVARLASELDLELEAIAEGNLAKLASRAARNVISGSGDQR